MAEAWVALFFLQFYFSSPSHQRQMACVLRGFPWWLFVLWLGVLMSVQGSSGIWLFFVSGHVKNTMQILHWRDMFILITVHSHSKVFSRNSMQLLSDVFEVRYGWSVHEDFVHTVQKCWLIGGSGRTRLREIGITQFSFFLRT